MNKYQYDEVKTDDEVEHIERSNLPWTILCRQMFVVTGIWVLYFSLGLSFGAPTVLIYQIRREANSTDAVSFEMESWLSSIHGYCALPFVFIIPIAAQRYGRKKVFLFLCLNTAAANVVFYCSAGTLHVLISEIMQGVLLGGNLPFILPTCSDYSSPHYRGIFMAIMAASFFWGVWVANAVGVFFHWKNIGAIGILCCVYSMSALFWPESPAWLAINGRYEEAATAHHWLKGFDTVSEKELANLIKSQIEHLETRKKHNSKTFKGSLIVIKNTITTKAYYYPLLMIITIMSLLHFSGKMVCVMYVMQLIHQITNSDETAFIGMLLLEGITIIGMSFSCIVCKYLNRRTLLLSSSTIAVVSLYMIALYLYVTSLGICVENKIISLLLLAIFSVTISCGPPIMSGPIFGEIVALRYRCSSLIILTFYAEILMATLLKLAPNIFRVLELHGAFLLYAIISTLFTVVLFIYLPETKGKSLQEIEDFFKN